MYSDLFSGGDAKPCEDNDKAPSKTSELEEINAELQNVFNLTPKFLSPSNLERVVTSPGAFILRSVSHNPFYNLALEDYIFQRTPILKNADFKSERLLFYVNNPSVIIGKNQTPWRELYLRNCAAKGYQYLRRKSGGGAVVHDLGNINYSFITSRDKFRREYFNRLLVRWLGLNKPTAPISLNERSDITLAGKKVSGSAFKIAGGKAYHHGTMLVSSDVNAFSGLLKPDKIENIEWNGGSVDSVRSDVANLAGEAVEDIEEFVDICVNGFRSLFKETVPLYFCEENESINDDINSTMRSLQSEEWLYKASPKFSVTIEGHTVTVEKGIIVDSTLEGTSGVSFSDFVQDLNSSLIKGINANL